MKFGLKSHVHSRELRFVFFGDRGFFLAKGVYTVSLSLVRLKHCQVLEKKNRKLQKFRRKRRKKAKSADLSFLVLQFGQMEIEHHLHACFFLGRLLRPVSQVFDQIFFVRSQNLGILEPSSDVWKQYIYIYVRRT